MNVRHLPSIILLGLGALLLSYPIMGYSQSYAIGDPMIIPCPTGLNGEMTVVETNIKTYPWQVQRWSCEGLSGLVPKIFLLKYLVDNPPDRSANKRWQEKCPAGSVGTIIFNSHESRRFVESWTCSINGSTKMPFPKLKQLLESNTVIEGADGVTQKRACPLPYKGSYTVVFKNKKWELQDWECTPPGSDIKTNEATMRMLMPVQ